MITSFFTKLLGSGILTLHNRNATEQGAARLRFGVLKLETVLKCLGTVFLCAGLAEGQVSFTGYSLPSGAWPSRITAGPDGAMWFAQTGEIGRISLSGEITTYMLPTALAAPLAIVSGPDGALWFTEPFIPKIGRITTSGNITEFALPTAALVFHITSGPDGALWFTAANQIGRITTAGSVTMFSLPPHTTSFAIASGPDGALWFTDEESGRIGRMTTSGAVTFFDPDALYGPFAIIAGPDGAMWFTEGDGMLARITMGGIITKFSPPGGPYELAVGPDGAIWYSGAGGIGRMTTSGRATFFPSPDRVPTGGIAKGPGGTLWTTQQIFDKIVRATLVCALDLDPTYVDGSLSLQSTVWTKQPLTWNSWLVSHTGMARLWSIPLGVVNPPAVVNVPIPGFPPSGNVGVLSTLSNSTEGMLCGVWKTVFTGGSGATVDDLQRRVLESGIVKTLP